MRRWRILVRERMFIKVLCKLKKQTVVRRRVVGRGAPNLGLHNHFTDFLFGEQLFGVLCQLPETRLAVGRSP